VKTVLIRARFHQDGLDLLSKWVKIKQLPGYDQVLRLTTEEMVQALEGCQGLVIELDPLGPEVFKGAPQLEFVGCTRSNPVNVDLAEAARLGIPVMTAPGRNAVSVAELTVALMINLARHVVPAHQDLAAGGWGKDKASPYVKFQGIELLGRTVGLVGLGQVARQVAQRLAAFEMRLLAHDPFVPAEEAAALGVDLVDLATLLKESDFVSLHLPLTKETEGFFSAERLARMKPSAYLINTARGALVDEAALIAAVEEGRLKGAAVDVYATEPVELSEPLLGVKGILTTPHISGATVDVVRHHSLILAKEIIRFLKGEKPLHLAAPPAG